jgi:hypothetical protein
MGRGRQVLIYITGLKASNSSYICMQGIIIQACQTYYIVY